MTIGQVVIRDSVINEGFNMAKPWADAAISKRPFSGNTGTVDDKDNVQRALTSTACGNTTTAVWVAKWLLSRSSKMPAAGLPHALTAHKKPRICEVFFRLRINER
ncbi:acyl-CoA thioester hydrolase YbgC domain protein [Enterobacter hormaechei subsp. xiangfangensis]|nr:acyl-CoA thioester hydrolase YbgC domain protein [Enterobacter hormaechei subsp. xiangfangensis]